MQEFILSGYLWFKALHVIAFISWMAGLLYLPRLFVYHADAAKGSQVSETFKTMEYRLYSYIMRPAMIATWVFGAMMLYANWQGIMSMGWMHAKLTLVIGMTGVHHVFGAWLKKFAADENMRPAGFYRIWNEVPTLIMIAIVLLAVAKPF
ncbi:MAG: protoporphyrinogen oxidase HemJ [Micavibrio aeruginosavorus]|uniref:Protoporphyrinogen IX oxidase n=1 Tax=Micavibrio aeruginosavorus TaxID=349221 RepID=A0A2W5A399_9BACT|nr:MAG: protoporphyrinogen oxidase HemJ [Micavibrio aeruginosavorus]